MTNAVKHTTDGALTLSLRRTRGQLRVDLHGTSPALPVPAVVPATETGQDLAPVASLPADWSAYHTPAGEAAYFTFVLQDLHHGL